MVAYLGGDFAVNTLAAYSFGANGDQWQGYVYTDRPVYRPGHTVHFKGILRLAGTGGYEVPAGRSFAVTINGPERSRSIRRRSLLAPTAPFTTIWFWKPTAALGYYAIEVKSGESLHERQLRGARNTRSRNTKSASCRRKPRVLQGETVQATIDARYYFGEPVNGAKLTYAVYRSRYWFPLWYDPDEEAVEPSQAGDDSDDSGDQVGETKGQLDADGKLTITLPTAVSERKQDFIYRIEARVTDQANREITGRGWVIATYGSFAVNA